MSEKILELKVESYRRIVNPYPSDALSKDIEYYILVVDITDLPVGISLKTNPRDQNMRTKVAGRIEGGLTSETLPFHILNRGILLSAKEVEIDPRNSFIKLNMGKENEEIIYGIVDGGHTYRTILNNQKNAVFNKDNKQYVKIEVLTGIEDIFQDVADSRNTSVQVSDKAIAELNEKFQILKDAIEREPYAEHIAYKENEEKRIDVADLIQLLFLFNIKRFPDKDSLPVQAYSAKASTLKDYLNEYKDNEDTLNNPYKKMSKLIPDFIRLFDVIESTYRDKYLENNPTGKFGSIRGVVKAENASSDYLEYEKPFRIPKGFIFPVIASFRALVALDEREEYYVWKADPFEMWDESGATLVEDTIERSRSFNNNPNAAGKDKGLWRQNYQTIFTQYLMEQVEKGTIQIR